MELLYFIFGIGFGYLLFRPKKEEKEKAPLVFDDQKEQEEKEPGPMTLRNGYGVTRCEKPTFAEQWVNIMNYSGKNQKEENYEETTENHTEDNLE